MSEMLGIKPKLKQLRIVYLNGDVEIRQSVLRINITLDGIHFAQLNTWEVAGGAAGYDWRWFHIDAAKVRNLFITTHPNATQHFGGLREQDSLLRVWPTDFGMYSHPNP